jgi:hypothetical protein
MAETTANASTNSGYLSATSTSAPVAFRAIEKNTVKVNGIAIRVGISKNGIKYTPENLQATAHELNDKPILKDHKALTDNTIGRTTSAKYSEEAISFEGWVKEDGTGITERIADGRIKEVSIGASVERLVKETSDDDCVIAEGIHYLELSTTPTPGVIGTSIALSIGESISADTAKTLKEALAKEVTLKTTEVNTMEETVKPAMPDTAVLEENQKLKAELEAMKLSKKREFCESITAINPSMKVDELMKEADERLALIKSYEQKLIEKTKIENKGVVVEDKKASITEEFVILSGANVTRALESVKPGQFVLERQGQRTLIYKMPDYSKQGWKR